VYTINVDASPLPNSHLWESADFINILLLQGFSLADKLSVPVFCLSSLKDEKNEKIQ
jgi:hypothetical protein